MVKVLVRWVQVAAVGFLFLACPFPEWNNNIAEFVETGMSGIELRSFSFTEASDHRYIPSGETIQVSVDILNVRDIELEYTVLPDASTALLLESGPVLDTQRSNRRRAVFSFRARSPEAEWQDLVFNMQVRAPAINKLFPDMEIRIRCDSLPGEATGINAYFDSGQSTLSFSRPNTAVDGDIDRAEIRYRTYDDTDWYEVNQNIGAGLVVFTPPEIPSGVSCIYIITLIDAAGQRSRAVEAMNDGIYRVYYYANADDAEGEVPYDDNYYIEGQNVSILGPGSLSREGWTFTGWAPAPTPPYPATYIPDTVISMGSADLNLYAVWEVNMYTVTFDYNGAPDYETQSIDLSHGAPVPVPSPDPVWDNHEFLGWFTEAEGGELWDFSHVVTSALTLYAVWEVNNSLTVELDLGEHGLELDPVEISLGASLTLIPGNETFVNDGTDWEWTLDGEDLGQTGSSLIWTPTEPGEYIIGCSVLYSEVRYSANVLIRVIN